MNRIAGLIPALGLLFFVSFLTPADAAADDPFQKRFAVSDQALKIARGGLQQAVDFANSRPDLFDDLKPGAENKLLTHQEELAVWTTWRLFCANAIPTPMPLRQPPWTVFESAGAAPTGTSSFRRRRRRCSIAECQRIVKYVSSDITNQTAGSALVTPPFAPGL